MFRERRIYSGALLEIERRHCSHSGRMLPRRPRMGESCAQQKEINLRNSRRRLMRWMNANFRRGDLHITVTMERALDPAERQKALERFLRRLRTACRRACGGDLRYICVKEDRDVRPHYHVVCQRFEITPGRLEELWGLGRVDVGTLDGNPDYGWLARYLTKQGEQDFYKKRWSQSKNLTPPSEPPPKVLKRKQLAAKPLVPKEYYVLASYRWGDSEGYTGEYIVAIRYDRRQELPEDIRRACEESGTWGEWASVGREETS